MKSIIRKYSVKIAFLGQLPGDYQEKTIPEFAYDAKDAITQVLVREGRSKRSLSVLDIRPSMEDR